MWLASLPDRPPSALAMPPRMHCLRSWDINYPGAHIAKIQGGVIGGALLQGVLQTGTTVEIRPGNFTEHVFVDKRNPQRTRRYFTVEPQVARIQTAKSGETQLSQAEPGGLIALGTTLCPTVSVADRLQGCVLGLPGTLPPVWEMISLVDLTAVRDASARLQAGDEDSDMEPNDDSQNEKLKTIEVGAEVRLHVGSDSVQATVLKIRQKRGKLGVALQKPLCAEVHSNFAIEVKIGNGYHLVAHARIADGSQCEIVEPVADKRHHDSSKNITDATNQVAAADSAQAGVDALGGANESDEVPDEMTFDLHEPEFFRERFLDELLASTGRGSNANKGIKIPPPVLVREGGAHCVWENFMGVVAALNRPPAHFLSFLASEGLSCHRAGEVSLFKYTWKDQKKKDLTQALEEARTRFSFSAEEWERSVCIEACSGSQVRLSAKWDFTKEHFPVEVSIKDAVLRIGSRGLGGPGKIYPKLCSFIRDYARNFVVCHQCRSACTELVRDRKLHHANIELACSACSARRYVPSQFNISA